RGPKRWHEVNFNIKFPWSVTTNWLNLVRFSTLLPGDCNLSMRPCTKGKLTSRKPKGLVIQEVGLGMLPASGFFGRPRCFKFLASTQKQQLRPRKTTCRAYIRTIVPLLRPPQVSSTRGTMQNTATASFFQRTP